MIELKGKKALVIGLGRSGLGSALLLRRLGASVSVTDKKDRDSLREFIDALPPDVGLYLGGHPKEALDEVSLLVISPGVPSDIEIVRIARSMGIEVIGELELAFSLSIAPFYAITGTNGKSTTTTLLDLMFKKAGLRTLFGGNIGKAISAELLSAWDSKRDFSSCIVEVSSFQLEEIKTFKPRGAAILNISPDHIDRYHSMEGYLEAKARIFMNQEAEDFLILNKDDEGSKGFLLKDIRSRVYFFSRGSEVAGLYLRGKTIYQNIGALRPLIDIDEIRIKGVHNLENAMAASAMALLAGLPEDSIREALREFKGLEHRLEFVRELDGVVYINDSKGTNVGAVRKCLEGLDRPTVLIAGGRDKDGDFTSLRKLVKEKVRAVVLIGEAKEKLRTALQGAAECVFADTLEDAVRTARGLAPKGGAVLLSPACASFDMFKDYEERGRRFKEAVMAL